MKIGIGVGHTLTGADYGAVGFLDESKCTREVGDLVRRYLLEQGHTAYLIKIDRASSINESLQYRVNQANKMGLDLYIEIHFNAGGGTGTETWIYGTGGRAESYAKAIVNSIAGLGYTNRGVKTGNLYVIKNTTMPAVLIECCFVDSREDKNKYNADNLAKAITQAIARLGGQSVPVQSSNQGGEYMSKVYKNGSTREDVFAEEKFLNKIGSLDPYECCEAIADYNGKIVVLYNGINGKKAGFVKYRGGL